jgi:hypothetical protein
MNAVDLLAEAERLGLQVRASGANLHLEADRPPPAELIKALADNKSELLAVLRSEPSNWTAEDRRAVFEERAAHLEYDAGLPRPWAEAFAKLIVSPVPGDFTPERWRDLLDGALRFADRWASKAHALGWKMDDVFGSDKPKGATWAPGCGIAWLLGGGAEVIALDGRWAVIRTAQGSRQRYLRPAFADPDKRSA